jgi:arginyl-tRNA--protein-N-Asp/Glu arginylyltransferase
MKPDNESESSLQVFQEQSPCPYFKDGRVSSIEYLIPSEEEMENYHVYLSKGYRRLGRIFYRNVCDKCEECRPLRIKTDKFKPGKSQIRTSRKNEDIRVEISDTSNLTTEKIMLYHKYVNSKHPGNKEEDLGDSVNILMAIHHGYGSIMEMEYYLEDKLVGVGIVDEGMDSLSSNYFYYDTDCLDRRLGIFSILKEIELAQNLCKKYYYLGFYIEENPKMSYKKYFRPNQVLENGEWREFLK